MARNIKIILYVCGSALCVIGFILILIWKPVFDYLLVKNIALTNGSLTEQTWIQNSVPIYFKVYMFNWSNPEETLNENKKPNFVEMGPYTFKFLQVKSNIVWNENSTLTFNSDRIWTFVPEMSNGNLSDLVTNINAVAMTIGDRAKDWIKIGKIAVNEALEVLEGKIYVTKTVEDLLFDGYQDRLLNIANYIKPKIPFDIGYLPEKFGWYFKKNVSEIDVFNIHTGTDNINLLGKVNSWNYSTQCGVYSDSCDRVRGSLGDLWPMNISAENTASIFVSDFCGAFDLIKVGNTERLYNVAGVRFIGTERTFDNGTRFPENLCYCKNYQCQYLSGIRDVSDCVHAPIRISFPHFYLADESYRQNVSGMDPVLEKHQFSVTLQKDSGIPMEIFARLQINVDVQPYPGIAFFSRLPKAMFPTVWFEEHAELPNDLRGKLNLLFTQLPGWLPVSAFVLMTLGAIIITIGCISSRFYRQNSDSEVPYTTQTE
ncbi:protein croquemort-like [Planococcus citri]|uniref:protein croquemort-like n=1 Tax=Planococcus citri TaxID=170843 RepID=UPI0031F9E98D